MGLGADFVGADLVGAGFPLVGFPLLGFSAGFEPFFGGQTHFAISFHLETDSGDTGIDTFHWKMENNLLCRE